MSTNCVLSIIILFTVVLFAEAGNLKSLEEAIEVGTSKAFENYFVKGGTAADLLDMFYKKTNINKEYINKVFLEAAKVVEVKDLKNIKLNIEDAVDFSNAVIKHFQKNPNAGREKEEDSTDEDEVGDYETKEEL